MPDASAQPDVLTLADELCDAAWPNLDRTRDAISSYDAASAAYCAAIENGEAVGPWDELAQRLQSTTRAIGEAFALDTADRNRAASARAGAVFSPDGGPKAFLREWCEQAQVSL